MLSSRLSLCAWTLAALLVGSASQLYADPILGPAGAGWQSWTRTDANQSGTPYWDGTSSDSASPSALLLEIAGLSTRNQFGWYDLETEALHPIFTGSDGPSLARPVSVTSSSYGFYLGVQAASNPSVFDRVYFSQPGRNTTDVGSQHFAVFRGDGGPPYWIGMEDVNLRSSDRDYNDMVVSVRSRASVPEPASASLMLLGLAVGARYVRRANRE